MNPVIESIYRTGSVLDAAGRQQSHGLTPVQTDAGALLYELVSRQGFQRTLEVGLAFGLSAMFICQAHRDRGAGLHIAIDPHQEAKFQSIGLLNVERAGLAEWLRFYQAPSFEALPQLCAEGVRLDLAFIDGRHTFDYALVDFFHVDRMLEVGGCVVFDDLWMPAIRKAVSYVLRNRSYELMSPPMGTHSTVWKSAARIGRRMLQDPLGQDIRIKLIPLNICVLKKTADDQRDWRRHRSF